jgi:iron complex outermembrane receptor protein
MKKEDIIGITADSTSSSFINFSFSVGVTRKLNENMSLGLSVGRGVRSADMNERFIINLPVGFDNYEYLGNPFIKPEANNELDLVYKYNNQNIGGVEVTVFYSFIQDYIGGVYLPPSVQKPLMQSVLGVKKFDNLGNANLYGFELSYATPTRNDWRVSLTTSYTAGTINEVEVLEFDANGKVVGKSMISNDPLGEIPPLNVNLNASYKFLGGKIVPSLNYRFSSSQDRVSVAMQEITTPSFSLFDMNLMYKHNQYFRVVGGINNIFDVSYYEHLNRRILGTNTRIYEPGRVFYVNLIFNI